VTRETLAALVGVGSVGAIALGALTLGGLAYARTTSNVGAIGGGGGAPVATTSATFSVAPSAMRTWLSNRQLATTATSSTEAERLFKVQPVDPF